MQINSRSKSPKKITLFFFIIVLISSCHIEKRRYLPGFYITTSHAFSKESDKKISSQILDFSKSKLSNNSVVSTYSNNDSIKEKSESPEIYANSFRETKSSIKKINSIAEDKTIYTPEQKRNSFALNKISDKQIKTKNPTHSVNLNHYNTYTPEWVYKLGAWWNLLLLSLLFTPLVGWYFAKALNRGIKERDPLGFIMCSTLFALAVVSGFSNLSGALFLASISLVFFRFHGINITKKLMPFFYKN
jgi:hypothetical protein